MSPWLPIEFFLIVEGGQGARRAGDVIGSERGGGVQAIVIGRRKVERWM